MMHKHQAQILAILVSEFQKYGIKNGHQDWHVSLDGDCVILQSWHKTIPQTMTALIELNTLACIRNPAQFILESTHARNTEGN